jgi:flavin-dependent dehydrogenase
MKVAIIGGGICGLYLSWKLSEKGYDVTLFEKKKKIGKEACSGLFSERILDFIPGVEKLIENQIDYTLLHFPQKTLKIKFSRKFFVTSHAHLDRLVAKLGQKSGAKIALNQNITSLPDGFERIIGCDGTLSQVRKSLGLREPGFRMGIQGFVFKKDDSPFVETWPTENGFLWKIPRGKEIEYGIIEKPDRAKKIFDHFLREKSISLERIVSATIPQDLIIPDNLRVTLCGDAAGLTKPWSGGGVIWGLIASDILLKNFPDFLKYKKEVKRFFLPRILFSKIVTRLVYFLGFKAPWLLPRNYKIESDFLL